MSAAAGVREMDEFEEAGTAVAAHGRVKTAPHMSGAQSSKQLNEAKLPKQSPRKAAGRMVSHLYEVTYGDFQVNVAAMRVVECFDATNSDRYPVALNGNPATKTIISEPDYHFVNRVTSEGEN